MITVLKDFAACTVANGVEVRSAERFEAVPRTDDLMHLEFERPRAIFPVALLGSTPRHVNILIRTSPHVSFQLDAHRNSITTIAYAAAASPMVGHPKWGAAERRVHVSRQHRMDVLAGASTEALKRRPLCIDYCQSSPTCSLRLALPLVLLMQCFQLS